MNVRNIFLSLSKYSRAEDDERKRDENYLTEAFIFLLNLILEKGPLDGVKLLNRICKGKVGYPRAVYDNISALTQVPIGRKIPDIKVFWTAPL